jgi:hypothetical protein
MANSRGLSDNCDSCNWGTVSVQHLWSLDKIQVHKVGTLILFSDKLHHILILYPGEQGLTYGGT